jgi:hypothetical protein
MPLTAFMSIIEYPHKKVNYIFFGVLKHKYNKKTIDYYLKVCKILDFFGSLAQSVEHRAFNPLVERSSRSRPTKNH